MNLDKIKVNMNLSMELRRNSKYTKALEYLEEIKDYILDAYLEIGVCYYYLNKYQESIDNLINIKNSQHKTIQLESKAYVIISNNYRAMNNFPKALEYLMEAKKIGVKVNNLIGVCNMKMKNFHSAIEYFTLALDDGEMYRDISYHNLGNTYVLLQQFNKAIENYEEAVKLGLKYSNLSISNCYFKLENYKKALEYALLIFSQRNELQLDIKFNSTICELIGNCYYKLKNFEKAIEYYYMASTKFGVKFTVEKIAKCMYLAKKYDTAINLIMNAHKQNGLPIEYFILGYCYFRKNNLTEAKKNFQLALKNNSTLAKKELESFYRFEDNEYIVDIDKMHAVFTLMTINQQDESLEIFHKSCSNQIKICH